MEVTFVASVQGHQVERVREMAERLRKQRPDVKVTLVEGDAAKPLLLKHKLQFGPAILVDGRVEYVGVPRWRFLIERIAQVGQGLLNPRSVVQPEKAASAKPPATGSPAAPAKSVVPPLSPTPAKAAPAGENPPSGAAGA